MKYVAALLILFGVSAISERPERNRLPVSADGALAAATEITLFSIRPCMLIRSETSADEVIIHSLIERAFANGPHSSHTEQYIVQGLRAAGALAVSLVVEQDHKITEKA